MNSRDLTRLNVALQGLHRSLLQYVGECWPWTCDLDGQELRAGLQSLVSAQQKDVAHLVDILTDTGWVIDYGTYPTEFTDLHYVSLAYLLKQLQTRQATLISTLESQLSTVEDDTARRLLQEIVQHSTAQKQQLQQLAAPKLSLAGV